MAFQLSKISQNSKVNSSDGQITN